MRRLSITLIVSIVLFCAHVNSMYAHDDETQDQTATPAILEDDYILFTSSVDTAFDAGLFDTPIHVQKPSRLQRLLSKIGVPVALKLLAFKNYLENKWVEWRGYNRKTKA